MQPSPPDGNTIKIQALQTIANIVVIIESILASHVCVYKWSFPELVFIIYLPVKSDRSIIKNIVHFQKRFCNSLYMISLFSFTSMLNFLILVCKHPDRFYILQTVNLIKTIIGAIERGFNFGLDIYKEMFFLHKHFSMLQFDSVNNMHSARIKRILICSVT